MSAETAAREKVAGGERAGRGYEKVALTIEWILVFGDEVALSTSAPERCAASRCRLTSPSATFKNVPGRILQHEVSVKGTVKNGEKYCLRPDL